MPARVPARLTAARQLVRLRRGLWAFPERVDPLTLPGRLTAPLPSYVSLQSALYFHGMISQGRLSPTPCPSLAPGDTTPLGVVSVHHVTPGFFFGFLDAGRQGALMASPEKALVDFLYLAPARSMLFRALPEVDLPRGFSARRARAMTKRIESPRRRTMVARALACILEAGILGAEQDQAARAPVICRLWLPLPGCPTSGDCGIISSGSEVKP